MSEEIIESLKEWFEKEWLYERHLTSELMKDKDAFQKGCEYFDSKNYCFDGEFNIQLRKEAGLAEVSRINKNIEKYATHCFRQIEKVFSEFTLVNPGRERIGNYLLDGIDMIQNPTVINRLNPSILNLLNHTRDKVCLNDGCMILKLNYIHKEGNYYYQAPEPESHIRRLKSIKDVSWNLTLKEQENIFKSSLWFNTFGSGLSDLASSGQAKPVFEAFSHMAFYRNINSHLNSESKPFRMPQSNDAFKIKRIRGFYENPISVMDNQIEAPGFYQRYVDMVLFLYSEYLRNPTF
jgi:hypothetical protein